MPSRRQCWLPPFISDGSHLSCTIQHTRILQSFLPGTENWRMLRPILDLSQQNCYHCPEKPQSKKLSWGYVWSSIRAVSTILTDAYLHIPMHASTSQSIHGATIQIQVSTIHLLSALYAFRVFLFSLGHRVPYTSMTGWYSEHPEISAISQQALPCHWWLGFHINEMKSCFVLPTKFTFLGVEFDTVRYTVKPTQEHRNLRAIIQGTVSTEVTMTGHCSSVHEVGSALTSDRTHAPSEIAG